MRAEEVDDSLLVLQARHEHVEVHSVDPLDRQPDMTADDLGNALCYHLLGSGRAGFASRRRLGRSSVLETGLTRARHESAIGATKSTRLVGLRRSLASLLIGWGLPWQLAQRSLVHLHRSLRWLEMGAQRQFEALRPQLGAMTADCWSGAPRGFMHYSVPAIQIRDHVHASAIRSRRRRSWQLDPSRTRQRTGARPALGCIVLCRRARPYPRPIPDGVGHQYVGQCWQEPVSSAEWRRAGIAGPYRDRHLGPSGAARPARIGRQKTRRYRILVQRA